jgi:glycosyltransferase involved in cell wall biosynthesis
MVKNIFLICDSYPLSNGEYFLDDEINFLSKKIDKIYVLTTSPNELNPRKIPTNVKSIYFSRTTKRSKFISIIKGFFSIEVWIDFLKAKSRFGVRRDFQILKIIIADFAYAYDLKNQIDLLCRSNKIDIADTVFYSYWHDKKALALAFFKKKYPNTLCVARGHGWDLDYHRHSPPFLPFKNFIIYQLDKSVSISIFGSEALKSISEKQLQNKIFVSRLGKYNSRKAQIDYKKNDKYIVCSCSNIIPLKRLHLIVSILDVLQKKHPLHWVHFGDGSLKKEIEFQANKMNLSFEIKGNVENNEILDFYNKNFVDLFFNVSEFEGIPVSIMEAQSAGIPVLATNVGGTSEIVNNKNGFLIEKDFNVSSAVEIIQNYFNESPENIKLKRNLSYKNWLEKYNAEKNYTEFAQMILS